MCEMLGVNATTLPLFCVKQSRTQTPCGGGLQAVVHQATGCAGNPDQQSREDPSQEERAAEQRRGRGRAPKG